MIARSLALAAALVVSSIACGSSTPPASSPSTVPTDARVSSVDGVSIHYVVEGSRRRPHALPLGLVIGNTFVSPGKKPMVSWS